MVNSVMEDIYLHKKKSNKGCIRVILILIIVVAGIFTWRSIASKRKSREEDESFARALDAEEGIISVPEIEQSEEIKPAKKHAPSTTLTPAPVRAIGTSNGKKLLADAELVRSTQDFASAEMLCYEILDGVSDPALRRRAEDLLGEIHIEMVFSPYPMDAKVEYTIKRGDTLGKLAKTYGTTVELIRKGNHISGSLIRVGDRYRILKGNFSIVVDKSSNDLVLNLDGRFFKRYRVGTGKYARTPAGEYKITSREAQPTWWRPDGKRIPYGDPENLLGTHWMSISLRGYGIHGTWEPESIGKQSSAGCVRMLNNDVEELYTLIPTGTPVVIQE